MSITYIELMKTEREPFINECGKNLRKYSKWV